MTTSTSAASSTAAPVSTWDVMPATVHRHLATWAGALPGDAPALVVPHPGNAGPGWDGGPQLVTGLVDPAGRAVVALPPSVAVTAA